MAIWMIEQEGGLGYVDFGGVDVAVEVFALACDQIRFSVLYNYI